MMFKMLRLAKTLFFENIKKKHPPITQYTYVVKYLFV